MDETTASLPTGTVTFLFTDIEDSSSRWDEDATTMETCLAIHNSILNESIGASSGRVVKTMGDGFMAVFEQPSDAVRAAVAAQRLLMTADWESRRPLAVRMGVHTGNVEVTDGDYLGPDVNRAARLEAAGHGGQILVSASTRELASASLDAGIELIDLGRHELRGLSRPEHIFQVVASDLSTQFPPLRTAEAGALRGVPLYHTSFVGRESDVDEILSMLAGETRLLTLVGQGGAGKTRLAAEVTVRAAGSHPHGAVFCSLASVESEELIIPALIDAIGFSVDTHSSDLQPKDQLTDYLRTRSILVVLDNFEHLLSGTSVIGELLGAGDGVSVLVTSRERLKLTGESIYAVDGLADTAGSTGGALAAELFIDRARQIDPEFDADSDPGSIERVCSLLGGLPLGIELAAGWVDVLRPDEIAGEILSNIDFLEAQEADRDERHRSLRAVFDSSWNMLGDAQKTTLRRLAVFRGGFDREAAEAVASADIRTLSTLVAKSLVRRPQPGRFDLHPLVGQFASELLEASGEHDIFRSHAEYYVSLLNARRGDLDGAAQNEARDLLRENIGNLRVALRWLADNGPQEQIIEILEVMLLFYLAHSWHEGVEMFQDLAARTRARSGEGFDAELVSASLDGTISYLIAWIGDLDRAVDLATSSLATLDRHEPGLAMSLALASQGGAFILRGDQVSGQPLMERAMEILDAESSSSLYALFGTTYGWSFYEEGDFDRAEEVFKEAFDVADASGATLARAYSISKLGLTADAAGAHERAIEFHHEGREAFVKLGDPAGEAYTLSRLSWTHWRIGDYERAREYALEGLFGFEQINHRWGTLATLFRLGMAEVGLGEVDSAEMHFHSLIEKSIAFTMPLMGELYGVIGLAKVAAARGETANAASVFASLDADPNTPKSFREMLVAPSLRELERVMDPASFEEARRHGATLGLEEMASLLGIVEFQGTPG